VDFGKAAKYLVVIALVCVAGWLLIWGPRGAGGNADDRVVIDYWEKWSGEEEKQMREVVDEFNATVGAEKKIFVRYTSTSAVSQKTLVATAAGVPPDVAGLWDLNVVQFAALDALIPLEHMAAEHGITSETYKPGYWKACNYDGHLYALVSSPAAIALLYNRKIFDESASQLRAAGLDPNRPPKTIAELDAYAKALDQVDSNGVIVRAGFLPTEPGWYISLATYWFGGTLFDEKTQKFTFTDPKNLEAMKWIASYAQRLGRKSINDFQSGVAGGAVQWDSPQNPFLTGVVAMEMHGPWMANYIRNLKPVMTGLPPGQTDNPQDGAAARQARSLYAYAPFPPVSPQYEGATYLQFDAICIPKGAKHPKEAFEWIAYLQRQDVMEHLGKLRSTPSPLAKVSDDFLNHNANPYINVFETLARSPNARGVPQTPVWAEAGDELGNAVTSVATLDDTPEHALQQAQDRIEKISKSFQVKQQKRHAKDGSE